MSEKCEDTGWINKGKARPHKEGLSDFSALLPCPFCGTEDLKVGENETGWFIECYGCTNGFECITTKKAASELWNTRVR